MFKEDFYRHIRPSSSFGIDRGSYKHSGVDYPGTKNDKIYCQVDGVVKDIIDTPDYFGTQCILYSNPRFSGGVNDILNQSYCHLYRVNVKKGDFIESGKVLGLMGNSGGSYTLFDRSGRRTSRFRKVSEQEQNNPDCNFGVHLHLWFYQDCARGKATKLLKELKKLKLISNYTLGDTHFYQWSKLIIAPRVIYSYFKLLQG